MMHDPAIMSRLQNAMKRLSLSLPHFSGLAHYVRLQLDNRVPAMGVFASGRILVNREFVAKLHDDELVFVLAHEFYHLALRTHDRAQGSDAKLFNVAHDYVINDILREELAFSYVPANGLD